MCCFCFVWEKYINWSDLILNQASSVMDRLWDDSSAQSSEVLMKKLYCAYITMFWSMNFKTLCACMSAHARMGVRVYQEAYVHLIDIYNAQIDKYYVNKIQSTYN